MATSFIRSSMWHSFRPPPKSPFESHVIYYLDTVISCLQAIRPSFIEYLTLSLIQYLIIANELGEFSAVELAIDWPIPSR